MDGTFHVSRCGLPRPRSLTERLPHLRSRRQQPIHRLLDLTRRFQFRRDPLDGARTRLELPEFEPDPLECRHRRRVSPR